MNNDTPLDILIVEKTADDRANIREMILRGSNRLYRFSEAESGTAAVRACSGAAGGPPDCVLLSYDLPDMNALEVLAELSDETELPPCPVVVLTGSDVRVGGSVLRAGAQDCIDKNWSTAEGLTRAIENAIERFEWMAERSFAERALRKSEERVQLAAQVAGFGIYEYDVAADTCNWSPELFALTGVPKDSVIRLETVIGLMHPEDRDEFMRGMQAALDPSGTGEFIGEFRVRRADTGETRWHQNRGQTIFDSRNGERTPVRHTGVVIDVTDRKRAEEARRMIAERYERQSRVFDTTLSAIADFVYVIDRDGRFLYANNALLNLWGLTLEAAVGKNFFDLGYPEDLAAKLHRQIQHVLASLEELSDEAVYASPGGASRQYEYIFSPVIAAEAVAGSTRDITARKSAEAALVEARRAAEAANLTKDRFLAVLSHELRTPLTPMLMAVAALEHESDLQPAVREHLAMIKRNIQLETKLIDDLLDLSRITTGKVELEIEVVDLNETLRQLCENCRSETHEKGICLETELSETAAWIAADSARLQQVLWNVLKNAIKFTPENGAIRVTTARQTGGRWEVRVQDTGIGISAEWLPRIFDAFEQGSAKVTRRFGGLGLGLAISKALVELHRGSIRAESAGHGQGATFVVELPGEAVETLVEAPESTTAESGEHSSLRLLLVEDHFDTARTICRLLRSAGFAVTMTSDVASATAAAESEPFDVLVSDLGLPDGDGYEIMRRIRAVRSVPGIAMSGYGMDEDRLRSHEAGFTEHLVKPIDLPQLIAAIRRVTDNRI